MNDTNSAANDRSTPRTTRLSWLGLAVLAIATGLLLAVLLRGGSEHLIEVPAGYSVQLQSDPSTEPLLPSEFTVAVGDTIRIVNHDATVHQIGPYTVGPGDTIEQTFTSPGRIEGICTFHPDGEIAILVR
jgi:plastocyanin